MKKFYRILFKDVKVSSVHYVPDNWPFPLSEDGKPMKNWNESLVLDLKNGKYGALATCDGEAYLVDEELKSLIESYTGADSNI